MFVNKIMKFEIPDVANCQFCDHKKRYGYAQDPSWCFVFNSDIYNNKPCSECVIARGEVHDTRIKN